MRANHNTIDTMSLGIQVAVAVAEARFDELAFQSHRLAEMVDHGLVEKQRALHILHTAAIASDLRRHGDDFVQGLIFSGFEEKAA